MQVFETRTNLLHVLSKYLDPQRMIVAKQVSKTCNQMIGALGRPEIRNTIFNLQLVDALGLMVTTPAET